MSESNISPYIVIVASAVTGIFTLLGVLLANKSSQKQLAMKLDNENDRQKKMIRMDRLEELYTSVEKWAGAMVIHHTALRKVMDGQLTYNQVLDLQIERNHDFDAQRMFMLAELYFSKCHSELKEIKKNQEQAEALQSDFKEFYNQSGSTSRKHSDMLTDILTNFNYSINNYKNALAKYINEV